MAQIRLDYNLALSQARQLEKASSECEDMARKVQKQISVIETSWSGESATAMIEKLSAWRTAAVEQSDWLAGLALNIRTKVSALKAVDEDKKDSGR